MSMKSTFLSFFVLIAISTFAQKDSLQSQIQNILKPYKAEVGVAIYHINNKEVVTINNDKHYPMQSVYKFHLALMVLHEIDKGKFTLDQVIHVKKEEMQKDTWSPIGKKYPDMDFDITIRDLLSYTVSQSDNNGCDILFRLVGGPKKVNKFIHKVGIKNVAIKATEAEMHKEWNVQFTNWSTPLAATDLLTHFYQKEILSKESTDFLWQIMLETSTGPDRIKGDLPEGTIVGHKTGTGGSKEGITSAINDIGMIILPNSNPIALTIFVTNSAEDDETNAHIIAAISKAVYDFYK